MHLSYDVRTIGEVMYDVIFLLQNQALKVTNFYNKLAEPNADKRNEVIYFGCPPI